MKKGLKHDFWPKLDATELAQLEERSTFNRVVVGPSPIFGVGTSM